MIAYKTRSRELWPISTSHTKQLEYLEKVLSLFFPIPVKSIKGRYFKSEDDSLHEIASKIDSYIERKLSLSLIFCHHCLPSYAQVFYHFFFLIVSLNDWQRLLQKRETRQIFMPTRIRSRIFQSRHVVMLDHVMLIVSRIYNFQKLKCSEL